MVTYGHAMPTRQTRPQAKKGQRGGDVAAGRVSKRGKPPSPVLLLNRCIALLSKGQWLTGITPAKLAEEFDLDLTKVQLVVHAARAQLGERMTHEERLGEELSINKFIRSEALTAGDFGSALRASELIGKETGLITHSHKVEVASKMGPLGSREEELAALEEIEGAIASARHQLLSSEVTK